MADGRIDGDFRIDKGGITQGIQKELGLPINTPFLYNYAKGKRSIKNMDIDTLIKISYILKEEPNELYKKILDYEKRKKNEK